MKQTEKLGLPLFEADDRIRREDFNAASEILDGAATAAQVKALVVRGMIVMWSGAATAIPVGWALCNGSNGTPDLRGKFVLGAGGTYSTGSTGGEATHRLTTGEMPSHSHSVASYGIPTQSSSLEGYGAVGSYSARGSCTTGSAGSGSAHNNMPPYYALCFIMKT